MVSCLVDGLLAHARAPAKCKRTTAPSRSKPSTVAHHLQVGAQVLLLFYPEAPCMPGCSPSPVSPPTTAPSLTQKDTGTYTVHFSDLASGRYLEGTYLHPVPHYSQHRTQGLETYAAPLLCTPPHSCWLPQGPICLSPELAEYPTLDGVSL